MGESSRNLGSYYVKWQLGFGQTAKIVVLASRENTLSVVRWSVGMSLRSFSSPWDRSGLRQRSARRIMYWIMLSIKVQPQRLTPRKIWHTVTMKKVTFEGQDWHYQGHFWNDELVKCRQQKLALTKENFTCITRELIYWHLHGPNGGQLLIPRYLHRQQFRWIVFSLKKIESLTLRTAGPLNIIISNLDSRSFESRN